MATRTHDIPARPDNWASRLLQTSGITWFLAAAVGQWIFVYYIAAHYIPILAKRGLPGLEETQLPDGYIPGDAAGNLAIAFHMLIAIIIIGAGPLQLMPQIRNRFRAFHRYVGRIYMTTAVFSSLAGLYLVWTRGNIGGFIAQIAISLDGVLIILFAGITLWFAIRREIDRHRRWAMRFFMVVSAVWFFRIGIMFWFMTTGGVGIDAETFTGPFITFLFFGQMFVPLLILEIYFRAQDSAAGSFKLGTAFLVFAATGATSIGVFAATMGMWLPRL